MYINQKDLVIKNQNFGIFVNNILYLLRDGSNDVTEYKKNWQEDILKLMETLQGQNSTQDTQHKNCKSVYWMNK